MAISSVYVVNMYPSIQLTTIRTAVIFFSRKFTATTKKVINLFLKLIYFGLKSTLISFNGKYNEYHESEKEEQGFAIGGYELAFLANLVVSYLFDKSKTLLN